MIKHSFTLLLSILLVQFSFGVVSAPSLGCISVDESTGNVTITWTPPSDPNNEFVNYLVSWSTSQSGPFTDNVVSNITTSSFTHTINANLNAYYYTLSTVYDNGVGGNDTSTTDIYSTIFPGFFAVSDSTATITWNPISTPNYTGNSNTYRVYRRIGGLGNAWFQVGTTTYGVEQFIDTFKVCSEDIAYKIEIANTTAGCVSVSTIIEDLFQDNTPPEVPEFDSVSVDPASGNLILGWKHSESADTRGYQIIYRDLVAGQNIIIDSTIGRFNTSYIDVLASGNTNIRQYGVAAFDTCLKGNPLESNVSSIDRWHRTVYLTASPNYCGNSVNLSWFNYVGWDSLSHYEILVSVNDSAYKLLDTVNYPDTTFIHDSIDLTNEFCYLIRAVDKDRARTSSSNYACPSAAGTLIPTIHYLKNVTVFNNQYVAANVITDSTIGASYYVLNRSLQGNDRFYEVTRIPFEAKTQITLIDSSAEVNQTDYYYKVTIEDSCGFTLAESNMAKTIYLDGDFDKDFYENNLNWTPYYGWDSAGSGVRDYQVHRILNSQIESTPVATEDAYTFEFTEDMKPLMTSGLQVCYFIQANESSGNTYGIQTNSISNTKCFSDNAKIFVPNAFKVGGYNSTFKPVLSFSDYQQYSMRIFNRYGQLVYETYDIYSGWDGKNNGSDCAQGIYVWEIKVVNIAGDELIRRGSVALLR